MESHFRLIPAPRSTFRAEGLRVRPRRRRYDPFEGTAATERRPPGGPAAPGEPNHMSTETHPRARHPRTNLSRRFFRGAVGLGTGLGTLIAIGALLGTAVASPALTVHFLAPFTGTGSESTSTNADNCGAGSVTKVPTVKLHTGLATGATRSTISSTGCPAAAGGLTSLAYTSVY